MRNGDSLQISLLDGFSNSSLYVKVWKQMITEGQMFPTGLSYRADRYKSCRYHKEGGTKLLGCKIWLKAWPFPEQGKPAAFHGQVVLSSVKWTHLLFYQLRDQLEMPFTVISSALLILFNTWLWFFLLVFYTLWKIKIVITAHQLQVEALHIGNPQRREGIGRSKSLDGCSRMVKRAHQGWLKERHLPILLKVLHWNCHSFLWAERV